MEMTMGAWDENGKQKKKEKTKNSPNPPPLWVDPVIPTTQTRPSPNTKHLCCALRKPAHQRIGFQASCAFQLPSAKKANSETVAIIASKMQLSLHSETAHFNT